MLIFQIVFCILSALCVAVVLPIGIYLGWTWAITTILLAVIFFMGMLLCKRAYLRSHKDDTLQQETVSSVHTASNKTAEQETKL